MKRISSLLVYILVLFPLFGIPKPAKAVLDPCPGGQITSAEIIDTEAETEADKYFASPQLVINGDSLNGLWNGMTAKASSLAKRTQYIGMSNGRYVFKSMGTVPMKYYESVQAGEAVVSIGKDGNFGYTLEFYPSRLEKFHNDGSEFFVNMYLKREVTGLSVGGAYMNPVDLYDGDPSDGGNNLTDMYCNIVVSEDISTQLYESFFRDPNENPGGPSDDGDAGGTIDPKPEEINNTDSLGGCNLDRDTSIIAWGICIVEEFLINTMIWILEKVTGVVV